MKRGVVLFVVWSGLVVVYKPILRLLVDLNFGSLHNFERTKVGIYFKL